MLSRQIMDNILWEGTEEGVDFWSDLCEKWSTLDSIKAQQIGEFLEKRYGDGSERHLESTRQYRHAFKIIAKYEERFDALPSVELLNSILE